LRLLKTLIERGLISWHTGKTNYEYYLEIRNHQDQKQFKKFSSVFEYVWYGKFQPGKEEFDQWQRDFTAFSQSLKA
jgi:hypothetical protein